MNALPIVFVHGTRVSGSAWQPVAQLVAADRRVATPDLPGHGSCRGESFTLGTAVAAVVGAIDELGDRALLVGHSLGGYVAFAVAGRHPERVAGVVAIGSSRRPDGRLGPLARTLSRLAAARPGLGDRLSAWGFRRALPAPVAEAMTAGGLSCEIVPQVLAVITRTDPLPWLRSYPGPVWLVNGTRDPYRADQELFLRACRDGHLLALPHRGHITCLADPEVLADVVTGAAAAVTGTA